MNHVFAIHIGNSTTCLAVYKQDDNIEFLANNAGDRVMPALVTVMDNEKCLSSLQIPNDNSVEHNS